MNKNSSIFERILQLAELKGIKNIPDLAVFLGYSNPEKLYRLKRSPDAKPSYDIIEDFTNKFEDLNVRWLVTGEGDPLLFTTSAVTGINAPPNRTLPPGKTRDVGDDSIHPYTYPQPQNKGKSHKNVSPTVSPTSDIVPKPIHQTPMVITVDSHNVENIVYVPIPARAGYLTGYGDPEFISHMPTFSLPSLNHGTYRAFEVDSNSMDPTLKNHELVIGRWIENLDDIREDRVHIIVTKHDGIVIKRVLNRIKKYGYLVAKSDATENRREYPNLNIYPEDILEIWYAVWHGGSDFKGPAEIYKRQSNLEADVTELFRRLNEAGI